jgi:hypothetical protein
MDQEHHGSGGSVRPDVCLLQEPHHAWGGVPRGIAHARLKDELNRIYVIVTYGSMTVLRVQDPKVRVGLFLSNKIKEAVYSL